MVQQPTESLSSRRLRATAISEDREGGLVRPRSSDVALVDTGDAASGPICDEHGDQHQNQGSQLYGANGFRNGQTGDDDLVVYLRVRRTSEREVPDVVAIVPGAKATSTAMNGRNLAPSHVLSRHDCSNRLWIDFHLYIDSSPSFVRTVSNGRIWPVILCCWGK